MLHQTCYPRDMSKTVLALAVLGVWLFLGRRKAGPVAPEAPSAPPGLPAEVERGIASFYGVPFHGRQTASGEIFDMHAMTAAHKTLKFHTRVEVTDLDTGRSVQVRITDRGPFKPGRIIDLSQGAAEQLGIISKGLASVTLRIV